jgi:DNA-directed RNA polymerase specialized sigma54-like protein
MTTKYLSHSIRKKIEQRRSTLMTPTKHILSESTTMMTLTNHTNAEVTLRNVMDTYRTCTLTVGYCIDNKTLETGVSNREL